ncbi:MAG: histidinol-phosphate aminotransferase [Candidatus Tokpelaia sp. JSC161]|nr:MAG: histidinol-phosphate aminotransferase [Candidatus Tokpelaia sp. JSC161]
MQSDIIENRLRPKEGIMDISAYVPGESGSTVRAAKIYKLSSNETPLGPPQAAVEAYRKVAGMLERYPDSSAYVLRESISEMFDLISDHIMIGNGSDELLGLLAQTYLASGDEAIITEHGFSVYEIQIRAAGARPVVVKEKKCQVSVNNILSAISSRTRVVFIANPSNPTGTYISDNEVYRLRRALPQNVLLVVDAAYAEYVREGNYKAGIELVSSHDNVVMTRTFSKIYGLAGLRIGWMYAQSPIINAVQRIRGPFNVNAPAQAAASAAIRDQRFLEKSVIYNDVWRKWLTRKLRDLGLEITPSVTNFLLLHFPNEIEKNASLADEYLRWQGYILRRVRNYGFPNALRLTIGTGEANRGVISVLTEFFKKNHV